MNLYQRSMANIHRTHTGEHFKFVGWCNGKVRYRSLATDMVELMTVAQAEQKFMRVEVCSRDLPLPPPEETK